MPEEEVTLSVDQPSTIAKVHVDLGDRVRVGQVVVSLDDREDRLRVEQAQAALEAAQRALDRARATVDASRANIARAKAVMADAEANYKRFEELWKEGAVAARERDATQREFDVGRASLEASEAQLASDQEAARNAAAQVEQAKASLEFNKKRLGDNLIRSPVHGAVKRKLTAAGEAIKEKTPVIILVVTDPLRFQGTIPERFSPRVAVGQPVTVRVEAYRDRTFPGRISRISPAVETESRSLLLEALVPNPKGELKPGFFARGDILTGTDRDVPFVPENAVYMFVGITKVFVVKDGTVEERSVKVGIRQDGAVEVEGVRPGEVVATSGLARLSTGIKVRVAARGEAPGQAEAKGAEGKKKTEGKGP
jgi:membrane fusion protein (multidrug efflux system)